MTSKGQPMNKPTPIFFDRIGDNRNPPILIVDDDLDDYSLRRAIREHVLEHGIFDHSYSVHPVVYARRIGGWDIVNEGSGYKYGTARRSPVFTEDTFAAAAEAALAGSQRTDAAPGEKAKS